MSATTCDTCQVEFATEQALFGHRGGSGHALLVRVLRPQITKEESPCCAERRDELGRLPIGYCSPDCCRRVVVL